MWCRLQISLSRGKKRERVTKRRKGEEEEGPGADAKVQMIGCDISKEMCKVAEEKKIYDRVEKEEAGRWEKEE